MQICILKSRINISNPLSPLSRALYQLHHWQVETLYGRHIRSSRRSLYVVALLSAVSSSQNFWEYRSVPWLENENGSLTEHETYSFLAQKFSAPTVDVKSSCEAARNTLQINPKILEVIRELRVNESGLAVYAMFNISAPDWKFLSAMCTSTAGNDEKSVNGIIINSGIVGSATEKWDQDLQ